jgi:hypothetical protein
MLRRESTEMGFVDLLDLPPDEVGLLVLLGLEGSREAREPGK